MNQFLQMLSPDSILTLSALARQISAAVRHIFGQERYWVVAEVIGLKVSRGHCYLQLAEKDEINMNKSWTAKRTKTRKEMKGNTKKRLK